MRLKVKAVEEICRKCREKARQQNRPVECEAEGPGLYKFCERVYVYEIVDMEKGDNF